MPPSPQIDYQAAVRSVATFMAKRYDQKDAPGVGHYNDARRALWDAVNVKDPR